ncbi:MAG: hypothetical protein STSR0009_22210 [Methanoregula sp.]
MTFTRVSEIIHEWMGWCPNAPTQRTASAILTTPSVTINPAEPNGDTGGQGRISRGVSLAAESIKTLIKNKQLLWFSLLTGLAMLYMFAAAYALHEFGTYPYPLMDFSIWLALTFMIEMITVFCINFLFAGLFLGISLNVSGQPVTIREGLSGARTHVRSLLGWSGIMAFLGTAIYVLVFEYSGSFFGMVSAVISQFPFYFILTPEIYGPGPIAGGFHVLSAATFTVSLMLINTILFILTLFVVPGIVRGNKNLTGAIAESVSLIRKTWSEIIACVCVFCLILIGISATSLIFRVAYGIVSPDDLFFWYQGGWTASAALYVIIWGVLMVADITAVGIATSNLYTYGKTGCILGALDENPGEPAQ